MTSRIVDRPLIRLQKVAYGALGALGLTGTTLTVYQIVTTCLHSSCSSTGVTAQIFSTLGCVFLTSLSSKEFLKLCCSPSSPASSTTEKTALLGQVYFQQLQNLVTHLDKILEVVRPTNPGMALVALDDITTSNALITKLEGQMQELESNLQHPNKDFVLSSLKKLQETLSAHNSASNSVNTTPQNC